MPASSRGNWPKVAIGGLVLVNVALLTALVVRDPSPTVAAEPAPRDQSQSSGPRSPNATPADPTGSPSPRPRSPDPSATPTTTDAPTQAARSTRVLAVNSETLAWRGLVGPCATEPEVEVSLDGGRSWKPTSTKLRSLSRLRSFGGSSVFAVGGAEDCAPRYVATGGPGQVWRSDEKMLDDTWYRVPDQPQRVRAPGGRMSRPCGDELGDLAGLGDDNATALCADGTMRTTSNSGRTWKGLGDVSGGLAVGADDGRYALALRAPDCDGVGVVVLEADVDSVDLSEAGCAPVEQTQTGEVAVAIRDQVLWVWAGSDVATSTDRGRTWK